MDLLYRCQTRRSCSANSRRIFTNGFVLKKEAIIFEVKKTRSNLRDSQVGKELIVDIERYKARNDCKLVYCFVYDPDHYIRNPAGLEELSRNEDELIVKVVIQPKR